MKSSAVVTERALTVHDATYPFIFMTVGPQDTGVLLGENGEPVKRMGTHFSRQDGCHLARYACDRLKDGIYTAETQFSDGRRLVARITVREGSVERIG